MKYHLSIILLISMCQSRALEELSSDAKREYLVLVEKCPWIKPSEDDWPLLAGYAFSDKFQNTCDDECREAFKCFKDSLSERQQCVGSKNAADGEKDLESMGGKLRAARWRYGNREHPFSFDPKKLTEDNFTKCKR